MTENTENVVLEETGVEETEVNNELSLSTAEKCCAGGIISLAAYGSYKLAKDHVIPAGKCAVNWVKGKFAKKPKEEIKPDSDKPKEKK